MANWLGGGESIATGWGAPPQLHAPELGGLVSAILQDRRAQQLLTQKALSDAVKNVQAYRERGAYTDALRNAGLTQGQDISGLSDPDATRLAQLIQAQTPDTTMDAYHKALTNEAQARADALNDPDPGPSDPAEQRRQDAEKRRELSDRLKALQEQMKASELPSGAVPHALAPGETTTPGMYPFDVNNKRTDIPMSRVDDFNRARRVYDALIKQRAAVPPPGGGAAAGGGTPSGKYPVGTHARQGNVWYVKTATGWTEDPNYTP